MNKVPSPLIKKCPICDKKYKIGTYHQCKIVLKGKSGKQFLKRIEEGPTEKQKAILKEAEKIYSQIKRKPDELGENR
jgi:hypothetical protein